MASEDFSYMLEARPGAYIWLGAGSGGQGKMLHNAGYDFNDELLPLGASYWVQLVESPSCRARSLMPAASLPGQDRSSALCRMVT